MGLRPSVKNPDAAANTANPAAIECRASKIPPSRNSFISRPLLMRTSWMAMTHRVFRVLDDHAGKPVGFGDVGKAPATGNTRNGPPQYVQVQRIRRCKKPRRPSERRRKKLDIHGHKCIWEIGFPTPAILMATVAAALPALDRCPQFGLPFGRSKHLRYLSNNHPGGEQACKYALLERPFGRNHNRSPRFQCSQRSGNHLRGRAALR